MAISQRLTGIVAALAIASQLIAAEALMQCVYVQGENVECKKGVVRLKPLAKAVFDDDFSSAESGHWRRPFINFEDRMLFRYEDGGGLRLLKNSDDPGNDTAFELTSTPIDVLPESDFVLTINAVGNLEM